MIDVAFPEDKSNFKEFEELSKKLGYKEILFLSQNKTEDIILADSKTISQFKSKKIVFAKGSRENIERGAHVLFDFEIEDRQDFLHHRASGLNQVLCNLMKKNGSFLAFNFSSILNADSTKQAVILGRMQQNIKLCRKYKIPMLVFSFAEYYFQLRSSVDLRSFFLELGMHPKEFSEGNEKFCDLLDKLRKPL